MVLFKGSVRVLLGGVHGGFSTGRVQGLGLSPS